MSQVLGIATQTRAFAERSVVFERKKGNILKYAVCMEADAFLIKLHNQNPLPFSPKTSLSPLRRHSMSMTNFG